VAELQPLPPASSEARPPGQVASSSTRSPSEITFVRTRMFYARAALNARGRVHFGLRHIRTAAHSPFSCFADRGGQTSSTGFRTDQTRPSKKAAIRPVPSQTILFTS